MYISRIKFDINKDTAKKAISSPQVLHAIIENCFNKKNRALWRLDSINGCLYLLLVSEAAPNLESIIFQLCEDERAAQAKDYSSFLKSLENGQKLRFRFKGNPVHSVSKNDGKRGIVTPHVSEFHKMEWLKGKALKNGFALDNNNFTIVETGIQQFYKNLNNKPVKISYTTFEGVLIIFDIEYFIKALSYGIGRGKAYGCGLMTVVKL